jgi:hypothetical protein
MMTADADDAAQAGISLGVDFGGQRIPLRLIGASPPHAVSG